MSSFTIGQKIGGGFTVLILIAGLVGGVAAFTMRAVHGEAQQMKTQFVPEASLAAALNEAIAQTQLAARSYGLTGEESYLTQTRAGLEKIAREFEAARALSSTYPELVKLRTHLAEIDTTFKGFKSAIDETAVKNQAIAAAREKLNAAAGQFIEAIDKIKQGQDQRLDGEIKDFAGAEKVIERHHKLTLITDIRADGNTARITAFKAQALRNPALIADSAGNFEQMAKRFSELKSLLHVQADLEEIESARVAAKIYETQMQEIMRDMVAMEEIGKRRLAAATHLGELASETAAAGMQRTVTAAEDSSSQLSRASLTVQIMLSVAVAFGVIIAFFLIRGISRVLRGAVDSLISGSEQIVAAASQVSSASQSLASGASQQAASLEETTASIEEMTGMTKNNAASADQAREIAQGARQSADQSATSVTKLNNAMGELKKSSADVAKIVKSIDEIAFQTNILALNAAVEAARAGEAGMGFAVVAEEVRNLAQRSAQAAKETADKIETALSKSEEGARISEEVSGSLGGIIEQVRKLDAIVNEIAQASKEQSQGIGQVNDAITQIDKVTQSNAAAAEESASAAEELNAQAAELNSLVGGLLSLVGGERLNDSAGRPGAPKPGGARHRDPQPSAKPAPIHSKPTPKSVATNGNNHRESTPIVAHAGRSGEMDQFFK